MSSKSEESDSGAVASQDDASLGKGRLFATSLFFGIAVLMLLGLTIYSWVARSELMDARQRVFFFEGVNRDLRDLQRLVLDIETGQRGFLITGEDTDLAPFAQASRERLEAMEALRDKVEGTEALKNSIPRLESLIERREVELKEAIRLRREGDFAAASEAVRGNLSNRLAGQIRSEIGRMLEATVTETEQAEDRYRRRVDGLLFVMKLATVVTLLSGFAGLSLLLVQVRSLSRVLHLKEAKDEAERADREKTKFLASMNHEIRTPLNAMLGFSELLEQEVTTDRGKRFIGAIRSSGESLAELINDILDLSKIESGALDLDPEPIQIREFARAVAVMFEEQATEKGIGFVCDVEQNVPEAAVVDSLRLRQVLVNLVGNAMKFTRDGEVAIRFRAEDLSEESVPGEYFTFLIEVEDTGRGIPAEKQELVFEPFKQGDRRDEEIGGTGLGLSICRELVHLMDGAIELVSEEGVGSLFRVVLPNTEIADRAEPKVSLATSTGDFNDIPSSRILVVDDNPNNRQLVASFLEDSHHKVFFAENGRQALELMRTVGPDVVLMDIRMPIMTGDEARERMLEDEKLRDIPVIAVTASSLMRQEKRLRRLFDGYLRKPFSGARLLQGLRKALAQSEPKKAWEERKEIRIDEEQEDFDEASIDEVVSDPDGLRSRLEDLREKKWDRLTNAMVFSEVFAVADEIGTIGRDFESARVIDYAAEMRDLAESFDQEHLETHLKSFVNLIDYFRSE